MAKKKRPVRQKPKLPDFGAEVERLAAEREAAEVEAARLRVQWREKVIAKGPPPHVIFVPILAKHATSGKWSATDFPRMSCGQVHRDWRFALRVGARRHVQSSPVCAGGEDPCRG
jgi:hypothetical protein